jgi:hypothetical protein
MENNKITQMFEVSKKIKEKKIKPILIEVIETEDTIQDNTDTRKINIYKLFRETYKNNEFIPTEMVSTILKFHFPTGEILHSFSDVHIVLKIQIKDIFNAPINNWEYNRPPDMTRCPDIAKYICGSKKPIDTMFYLSYRNVADCFDVLDGIHRLTALRIIKKGNLKCKQLDFITGEDEDEKEKEKEREIVTNWLYNQYLLVNIRFNAVLGDLIDTFVTLNKSQTVPDLYIRDVAKEKRNIIEAVTNEWQIRFKKHFSSSSNPITGNTNRNKFIDLLDKIYDKYKINEACDLKKVLEDANTRISFNIPTKISVDIRFKCIDSGCYLFLYKNDKLEDFI